jgi:hypothetical protein
MNLLLQSPFVDGHVICSDARHPTRLLSWPPSRLYLILLTDEKLVLLQEKKAVIVTAISDTKQ